MLRAAIEADVGSAWISPGFANSLCFAREEGRWYGGIVQDHTEVNRLLAGGVK